MEDMVTKEFLSHFRNKKVLVTGHTGFKGSWFTLLLSQIGAEVTGYSLPPRTSPNLYDLLDLKLKCNSIIGDINDTKKLEEVVLKIQPDFIFHLAAQPLVRYSYHEPIDTFSTNIIGTANLLNACRSITNHCSVVCVTTDKVYHNNEWEFPYRENDQLGGYDPYSASKAAAEIVIDSYRNSYFKGTNISVASARAGNVIGGGDWSEDRLFPDIVQSINSNNEIVLRNPSAVRPWQHVLDPLMGYLKLAHLMTVQPKAYSQAWNFGPYNHESKTVLEVCEQAIALFQKGSIRIEKQENQPHEAGLLRLDISKAMASLNWQPNWSTDLAIEKTTNWYKSFLNGSNALELVQNNIKEYINHE